MRSSNDSETEQDSGSTADHGNRTGQKGRELGTARLISTIPEVRGRGRAGFPLASLWLMMSSNRSHLWVGLKWNSWSGVSAGDPLIMKLQAYHLKVTANCSIALKGERHREHASMKHEVCRSNHTKYEGLCNKLPHTNTHTHTYTHTHTAGSDVPSSSSHVRQIWINGDYILGIKSKAEVGGLTFDPLSLWKLCQGFP